MRRPKTGTILSIAFFSTTLGLIIYYFYRETVTKGVSAVERLLILGPMFFLGFVAMGIVYVMAKKRLKEDEDKFVKFRTNFYKLVLLYGSTFIIFVVWVVWDLIG